MINEKYAKSFCCEDISKIENYEEAIADTTQTWHCHHRLELIKTGAVVDSTKQDLIDWDIYWHRPADELIFLTRKEHTSLHHRGKTFSQDSKRKMSEARKGKPKSEEHRRKLSDANRGKKHSEETRRKLIESHKGRPNIYLKGRHWKLVDGKRVWY